MKFLTSSLQMNYQWTNVYTLSLFSFSFRSLSLLSLFFISFSFLSPLSLFFSLFSLSASLSLLTFQNLDFSLGYWSMPVTQHLLLLILLYDIPLYLLSLFLKHWQCIDIDRRITGTGWVCVPPSVYESILLIWPDVNQGCLIRQKVKINICLHQCSLKTITHQYSDCL